MKRKAYMVMVVLMLCVFASGFAAVDRVSEANEAITEGVILLADGCFKRYDRFGDTGYAKVAELHYYVMEAFIAKICEQMHNNTLLSGMIGEEVMKDIDTGFSGVLENVMDSWGAYHAGEKSAEEHIEHLRTVYKIFVKEEYDK